MQWFWKLLVGALVLRSLLLPKKRAAATPQRIVVVAACRLGDLVLATPLFRALKEAYPKAHLAVVVQEPFLPLLKNHPHVDSLLPYRRSGSRHFALLRTLQREKFDLALHLFARKLKSLTCAAQIPMRVGFAQKYPRRDRLFLTHLLDGAEAPFQGLSRLMLRLLEPLGKEAASDRLELALDPEELPRARALLPPDEVPFLILHVGTEDPFKQWPHYGKLIALLLTQTEMRIVLTGTSSEMPVGEEFAKISSRVFNLMGKTSVGTLMALCVLSRGVVGNDTGPLLVARALGVRRVVIYGPAHPDVIADGGSEVLVRELACRPRASHPFGFRKLVEGCASCTYRACTHRRCLADILPAEVMERIIHFDEQSVVRKL